MKYNTTRNTRHINIVRKKDVSVMKYVITKTPKMTRFDRLQVIRMEIDYELVTLNDALTAQDTLGIAKTKEKLSNLVYERQSIERTLDYI